METTIKERYIQFVMETIIKSKERDIQFVMETIIKERYIQFVMETIIKSKRAVHTICDGNYYTYNL